METFTRYNPRKINILTCSLFPVCYNISDVLVNVHRDIFKKHITKRDTHTHTVYSPTLRSSTRTKISHAHRGLSRQRLAVTIERRVQRSQNRDWQTVALSITAIRRTEPSSARKRREPERSGTRSETRPRGERASPRTWTSACSARSRSRPRRRGWTGLARRVISRRRWTRGPPRRRRHPRRTRRGCPRRRGSYRRSRRSPAF